MCEKKFYKLIYKYIYSTLCIIGKIDEDDIINNFDDNKNDINNEIKDIENILNHYTCIQDQPSKIERSIFDENGYIVVNGYDSSYENKKA